MKIAILGAGESGVGTALLAKFHGWDVFVSDAGIIKKEYKAELTENAIPNEEGTHTWERISAADIIMKSPGIPDDNELVVKLRKIGKSVISEIEFAFGFTSASIIGITGSNGKTTTTMLTWHLIKSAGYNVALGGNVGFSFARNVIGDRFRYHVLELSSFQLDGIETFRPDIAILLNITPDHLDRYDYKMGNYVQSKFRITMNQKPGDTFIVNAGDSEILEFRKKNILWKNSKPHVIEIPNSFEKEDVLNVEEICFDMRNCRLKGQHNLFNASCAIVAALQVGVAKDAIQEALETFEPIPHRLEIVAKVNGVEYINDSKATNVDSVFYALQAMQKPVIWIAGGTDKGNDYEQIASLVRQKVKALICLGIDNSKLIKAFSEDLKYIAEVRSAADAVKEAAKIAQPDEVVLLSPACASFDLFRNYEDRGNQFRQAVKQLENVNKE
jgi:UDP-N-acetylmuramoylalanine--D-glutamate ligase